MKFNYSFVRKGETAPDKIAVNDFWLDVGNRFDIGVIDHHHGERKEWSAAELFRNRYTELILPNIEEGKDFNIHLHEGVDLDAVFCVWLFKKVAFKETDIENDPYVCELINVVSENDQGYSKQIEPKSNWPVVFRLVLETSDNKDDSFLIAAGLNLIDKTYEMLKTGKTLEHAALSIVTVKARIALEQGYRNYLDDLSSGIIFQVKLPNEKTRWCMSDALYLKNPKSLLFKEYARSDFINSWQKLGFTLLIIATDEGFDQDNNPLIRYIISTDPISGLNLVGLGEMLEKAEQNKEDEKGFVLPKGRERLEKGQGRFGTNVQSPWYDGRGHDHTILDCPSFSYNHKQYCASRLTEDDLLNVIWEYGDPAGFINFDKANLYLMLPVKAKHGKAIESSGFGELKDFADDFSPEVYSTFEKTKSDSTIQIGRYLIENIPFIEGFSYEENFLIYLDDQNAVLLTKYRCEKPGSLRELIIKSGSVKKIDVKKFIPKDFEMEVSYSDYAKTFITCCLGSKQAVFDRIDDNFAGILYRLSGDFSYSFFDMPSYNNISPSRYNSSTDHKKLFFASSSGFSLCSLDPVRINTRTELKNAVIISIVMLQKISLKNLFIDFVTHRSITPTNKDIINDRWKLIKIEQILLYTKISENDFSQKAYEISGNIMKVTDDFKDTKEKIEILALQARDVRADFMQLIGNIISILIAPIVLTSGFFSGIHFDRHYGEKYFSILFKDSKYAGWWQFLTVFTGAVIISWFVFAAAKLVNSYLMKRKKF